MGISRNLAFNYIPENKIILIIGAPKGLYMTLLSFLFVQGVSGRELRLKTCMTRRWMKEISYVLGNGRDFVLLN